MEYSVEELARASALSIDTIRYYQGQGLLPSPARQGRRAVYRETHLERLQQIQELKDRGLKLAGIRRAMQSDALDARDPLLDALSEVEGERSYDRDELGRLGGVPEFMIEALESAGLLHPLPGERRRYTEADLRSLQAGRTLLEAGIPLQELLPLAQQHARQVESISDRAIELFDRHRGAANDPELAETLRELLPAVTTLVAMHFQRTLIRRTRARLVDSENRDGLEEALAETERSRLKVSWS